VAAAGIPAELYEYRPTDFSSARLRMPAAALDPVYLRVSGSGANQVYFHDSDDSAAGPAGGFHRRPDPGAVEVAPRFRPRRQRSLLTSFAFGGDTRDAAAQGRDIEAFRRFFREAAPESPRPGSTGERRSAGNLTTPGRMKTEDLLKATGPVFDVFSYHIYTAVSQRCAGAMPAIGNTAAAALSREWLSRPDRIHALYADLRPRQTALGSGGQPTPAAAAIPGHRPFSIASAT
jgi:hypothetical protein